MIFQISFTSLVVVSFSSLNVLKTVDFMSLTNNSYVGSSSGIVSVKLFFYPVNRHHLPVYFVNFVVAFENQIFWILCCGNSCVQILPVFRNCWLLHIEGWNHLIFFYFLLNYLCKVYILYCVWSLKFLFYSLCDYSVTQQRFS